MKLAFADPLRAEVAEAFDLLAASTSSPTAPPRSSRTTRSRCATASWAARKFGFIGAIATATHACVDSEWLDAPRSPRQILQWWGTEYRRRQNDHYWIAPMAARVGTTAATGRSASSSPTAASPTSSRGCTPPAAAVARRPPGPAAVEGTHASAQGLPPKPRSRCATTRPGRAARRRAAALVGDRQRHPPEQLRVEIAQ
jgi:hypothetical protein